MQDQLPSKDAQTALVVVSRADQAPLSGADRGQLDGLTGQLSSLAAGGRVSPAQVSPDGTVALVAVPLSTEGGPSAVVDEVEKLRETVGDLPGELTVEVTGGPAFTADLGKVFQGADTTLLLVTAAVVAVLLLVTYRSPFLWLVPLLVVGATEQITLRVVESLVPAFGIYLPSGQVTGIASVLVFGAATNYALLLIARYREELRREEDRFAAMRSALRRTAEPILASGSTVVLGVLTLLLSEQETNRALAIACATGVILAMLSALFVLPAALLLFGRGLFWPFIPRVGSAAREGRIWGRLGEMVIRRPLPFAALAAIVGAYRIRSLVRDGGWVVGGSLVALAGVTLVSGLGLGFISGLEQGSLVVAWTSPPTAVGQTVGYLLAPFGVHVDALPVTRAIGMVVLVGVLIWLWFRSLRRGEPFWHAGLALTATVALSPLFHPWYWLWPLAVLAATGHRTLWFSIVTVVSSFLVLADGTGLARYSKMPGAPLMTLFVIGVVVWLVRSARKGRQPVPAD
ncbi:hypothetical protein DLJ57_20180 [Micromonospora chalcea]|nr:hypothetical protein DLJ57_20180 [Micromonospora chalcea]